MKTTILVAIVCISILIAAVETLLKRRRLRAYWDRICTGSQWRRRFPLASKDEIRRFLDLFVAAFAFRQSRKFCFAPDDRVLDVYRALYPPKWSVADCMELETLGMDLERAYGIDLVSVWREDLTLGDLFALTHRKSSEPAS
jgi:propanediol dehydratase small subunit